MSKISLAPDVAGTGIFTIASPNSDTNRTLTLPDDTGTIVTNSGNQAGSFTTLNTSGQVVFNDAGADVDFRVEGDTNANLLFVDASTDRVGIGTSTPGRQFTVFSDTAQTDISIVSATTGLAIIQMGDTAADNQGQIVYRNSDDAMTFGVNGLERMRIDSSGNLLVGTTSAGADNAISLRPDATSKFYSGGTPTLDLGRGVSDGSVVTFQRSGNAVGSISVTLSATAYNTSSDYRLKENVAPMAGALAKVLELNPVTYTWKVDGSAGEGFIAHELQAVCPDAVSGEKDGEEMQGVDYGKITPLLTAALQEAIAKIETLEARIAVLEAK